MTKIKISTKFNKTGTRILKTPLDEKQVCAPAEKQYKRGLASAETKFRTEREKSRQRYVDTMSHLIAAYISCSSTPAKEKYTIIKFLVEVMLKNTGPICTKGPGSWQPWSEHLWGVPELCQAAEDAWAIYVEEGRKSWDKRDEAIRIAAMDCSGMRAALWREIEDHTHYQVHPNGDKSKD